MKPQFNSLQIFALLTLLVSVYGFGAGTRSDYGRAERLAAQCQNKVFRSQVDPHWLKDNKSFWYEVQTDVNAHEFILVNAEKGIRQTAFDHSKLAKALNNQGIKKARAESLNIDNLDFDAARHELIFDGYGKSWRWNLKTSELNAASDRPVQSLPAYVTSAIDTIKPPRRNGKQTAIKFMNNTAETVELFWINAHSIKKSYGKIKSQQTRFQNTYAGHVWLVCDPNSNPIAIYQAENQKSKAIIGIEPIKYTSPKSSRKTQKFPKTSHDGTMEVFIKNYNLWLRDLETKNEIILSNNGTEKNVFTQAFWSPDSKKLIGIQTKKATPRTIHMVESSPEDQLHPKLHSIKYRKPGDKIDLDHPCLFDIQTKKQIPVNNTLFNNPWSLSRFRWEPDSSRFTFLYNQRGHQVLRIIGIDAEHGKTQTVLEETSKTFITYSSKFFYKHLEDANEIIWMSEGDGWNHLYLFDAATGKLKNQITKGKWVVRHVDKVDEDRRQICFRAGGVYPGQDPYYLHYCRVNFDGTGFTILTEDDGTHEATFSPDRKYFVDKYSRIDMPPIHELRHSEDGKLICQLEKADWSKLLDTGWQVPERFVAKGRDDSTDIYGMIIRPTNFDHNDNYPIIESIYAGPHSSFVPKSFKSFFSMNKLAELGFIVVKIDGMGTSHRSKEFHDVCWKNLSDAGFPDRIKWIEAVAQKYPYMDISQVGIYGGSAGGQNAATAVMKHGDFYKVAVADCGCHDNRMDKIWWNEQWMGWPIGPHYEANSNVTLASQLQGKLLLTVGELDRNVDPASTMQLVNALIKAEKDFDMLVVPEAGHGVGESKYASRRRADYFVRHLLGIEPRSLH